MSDDVIIRAAITRKLLTPNPITFILGEPCMYAVAVLDLLAVHQEMWYSLDDLAKKAGVDRFTCEEVVHHLAKLGIISREAGKYGLFPKSDRQKALIKFIEAFYKGALEKET